MATNLQYVKFNDFRPGIFTRSDRALGTKGIPAPQGAAQFNGTYRCHALQTGGLAPLPSMIKTWTGPTPSGSGYIHGPWTVGAFAFGPISKGSGSLYPDCVFLGVDYIDSGTGKRAFRVFRHRLFDSPYGTDTIVVINTATASPVDQYWGMTFCSSRMNAADPTALGTPIVAFEWSEPGPGTSQNVWTFPDPAAVNVTGVYTLASGATAAGQILGHQGRVVRLTNNTFLFGATGGVPVNEQVDFTDPPNSITMTVPAEVFSQENPVGYGAWGSISAGELVLIKNHGGAVIVSGDIAFPNITRLPGVVSTGMMMARAAPTPQGLFYYSNEQGVYSWRGSDTSQFMSPQLDPSGFINNPSGDSTPDFPTAPIINNAMVLESWHNWVLMSNNWLYDGDSGGWWQIENQATRNIRWWTKASHFNLMYGAPVAYSPSGALFTYDRSVPCTSYSWTSQPLAVTQNRLLNVREINVLVQGSGTVTITLTKMDGSTQPEVFTVTKSDYPQLLRLTTEAKGWTVMWSVTSDSGSTSPAPVVHSVEFGWEESQEAIAS